MGEEMENIVSFAEKTWDSFEIRPFGAVDSLILSWMSYLHWAKVSPLVSTWRGVRFADLFRAECFEAMVKDVWRGEEGLKLFVAMAASPRYRDMRVKGFAERTDEETETQFAAVCFQLFPGLTYVAFRGTDTSLVGWKEDFNMAFQYPVPAQEEAVTYLRTAGRKCRGKLLVGGHSKGGNLSICAAFSVSRALKQRIERVYSHDGPGFLPEVLRSEAFHSIQNKIDKTLPQDSVVGLLLEHQEQFRVVRSNQVGFWQHDPFSWEVRDGDFCDLDGLTPNAHYVNQTISEWLNTLSEAERERFVDVLYELLRADQAASFSELLEGWQNNVPAILQAAAELDPDTKKFLGQTLKELAVLSVKHVPDIFLHRGKKK